MKKALCTIILLSLFKGIAFAQNDNNLNRLTVEEAFFPKMPTHMDTIYYPFYNGVQMIEVDHIGFWDRKIYFLEQTEPRAMSHSMFNPMPIGNEYFFRNTTGTIVKAFNSKQSLTTLTRHFKKTPIDKKSNGIARLFPYHSNQGYRSGIWYQSPQPMFNFSGLYKVSTGHAEQSSMDFEYSNDEKTKGLKFGLIDSLGNEVIPIQYDVISPIDENLLVQKNGKWGIINYKNIELVPLSYDNYQLDNYSSTVDSKKNVNVFFLTTKESENNSTEYMYTSLFLAEENKLISLNNYDEVYHQNSWSSSDDYDANKRFLFVLKNGKRGLLNGHYQEIIPPEYEILEFSRYNQRLYRVAQNGKFGFWDENFKEKIPLEYDYVENFKSDSTALVLKNGDFYCINTQNLKQANCTLKPNWKIGHLGFVTDKDYISVRTSDFFGIVDKTSNSMILPFKYESFTPIEINSFFDRNKSLFEEKKVEYVRTPDMINEMLFHNNKIIVKNNHNKYGVIDTTFNVLIKFDYESLEAIQCNLNYLIYSRNGNRGAMDFSEKDLLSKKYDELRYDIHYEQERDIFQVKSNGKWGIVNFENKTLVPCVYDSIDFLGHWNRPKVKLWVVEKNKKFGVVNEDNEIFIPFEYNGISHLEGYNLWVGGKDEKRYRVVLRQN